VDSPVAGYNVFRNGDQIGTTATNSYQDSGLSPSTTYTYTVSAYDPSGNTSAKSAPVVLTTSTDTQPPSVPQNLTAQVISAGQIDLSWTASTDNFAVAGYYVYRFGAIVGTVSTTSYQDTGLMPDTTYSYWVAAFDASGNISGKSNGVQPTTLPETTPPTVPTNVNAGAVSATQINVTWTASTDSDSPVAGYNVYRNGTMIATTVNPSYQDSGLMPSTTYSYTVSAYDPSGNTSKQSASASATTLPDTMPPSVPTGLAAQAVSSTQVNLSWNPSTDPDSAVAGYNVYRNGMNVGTTSSTKYQDTGLAPNTTYTYAVSAFDAAGNTSARSTSVSITTEKDTTQL
jgi:chitodextrinase